MLARIAGDASRPPVMRANALGHLRNFGEPASTRALLQATSESHPLLRTAAMLSLADRGRSPEVRQAMETALTDARRTVRMAAAVGLLNAGLAAPLPEGSTDALQRAMREHANRARFLNEDPEAQLELGKMYFLAGRWKRAESSVRDALKLDSKIAGGQYFLGLATLGQGRVAEARALLRKVDRNDPHRKDAEAVLAKLPTP
jgi:tetratricopeptide (TPR) repeat protein